jgi:ketosteroid isomerase-like protein
MKVVMAVFASLASSSLAVEETDDSPKQFITDWVATFNKNDPELLSTFYDQSEELEVIVSAGVRHHGYKAVQKFYIDDHKPVRFYDSKATNISTRILADTALVTFEHQFKVRITEDDSCWQVHVRTTSVLHRIDGKWKIVLEHSSPIRGTERVTRILE